MIGTSALSPRVTYLPKPFSPDLLVAAVRDGLEALRQIAKIRGESTAALRAASSASLEAEGREVRLRLALGFEDWLSLAG